MYIKKITLLLLCLTLLSTVLVGCGGNKAAGFKTNHGISVVSREDGSGTRGAFIELFGIQEKDTSGKKIDKTTKEAIIANKTDVMLSNISGDQNAIGYVSLGSLSQNVKALSVDGVQANTENVKNGTYKVSRPFNIVVTGNIKKEAQDFIDFILSGDGQAVVSTAYIPVKENAPAFNGSKPSGKIVIAGSSSVTPIMEKLKEAYQKINPNLAIEVQMSDSTAGITGAIDGTCDIGMASRDLKDVEKDKLKNIQIALDGIAIIVNPGNSLNNISSEDVKNIFIGEKTKWSEIAQ